MVIRDPSLLVSSSNGFLHPVHCRSIAGGVLVSGGYDLAHFQSALFEQMGIARPDSLRRAVETRLAEFLAGRSMAHIAQHALGLAPQHVAIGPDRAPVWPDGLNGSITHARGHCACLAIPTEAGHPGIDIETVAEDQALESILSLCLNEAERDLVHGSDAPAVTATRVFSAKETLFKALYPTVRRHFGFDSAAVSKPPRGGKIELVLTKDLHPALPSGRTFEIDQRVEDHRVMTWLVHKS